MNCISDGPDCTGDVELHPDAYRKTVLYTPRCDHHQAQVDELVADVARMRAERAGGS